MTLFHHMRCAHTHTLPQFWACQEVMNHRIIGAGRDFWRSSGVNTHLKQLKLQGWIQPWTWIRLPMALSSQALNVFKNGCPTASCGPGPIQKMVSFDTCLKQEGLCLGVGRPLPSFSLRLCAHKLPQAICCKHKVWLSLMKDDFLQYLQDHMNCAGNQPANLSPLHRNITWLAATALPN